MFQYQSAGTSMDSQTFFSVDTSMDLQQYQSTDMGTEIVMDNVDWIQGSRDIIVEGVSCESIELHEKSQMSRHQITESPGSPVYSLEPATYSPSSPVYSPTSPMYGPENPASDHRISAPSRSPLISLRRFTDIEFR